MVKPTTDDVLKWVLQADFGEKNKYGIWLNEGYWDKQIERFSALAYAAGAAAMKERAAKVAEWVLKMPENDISAAIRALGDDDE